MVQGEGGVCRLPDVGHAAKVDERPSVVAVQQHDIALLDVAVAHAVISHVTELICVGAMNFGQETLRCLTLIWAVQYMH